MSIQVFSFCIVFSAALSFAVGYGVGWFRALTPFEAGEFEVIKGKCRIPSL